MRLYISLTRDEIARLQDLAVRERRRPQDQAAVLLARALAHPETLLTVPCSPPTEVRDGAA